MFNKKCFLGLSIFCLIASMPLFAEAGEKILKNISPVQSAKLINDNIGNPEFFLIDMRTPKEFKAGHIDGARMINFYSKSFKKELKSLDKDKIYLIYCRSSNRTGKAMKIMKSLGFTNVYNMKRGLIGWKANRLPLVRSVSAKTE
jgi:rhodanese-related sulfurtransferase